MVISDSPQFIFVHIPKTAGKSVAQGLQPEGSPKHPLCRSDTKHETMIALLKRVGQATTAPYKTFAVIRNPLDRFVSHYRYLKSNPSRFPELSAINNLDAYADAIQAGRQDVIRRPERVMPQHEWVYSDDTLLAQQLFRFEDLPDAFAEICNFLGIPRRTLPRCNVSTAPAPHVSRAVRQFVARRYARDYELFGY